MSRATDNEIKKQTGFCKELADRLYCDTCDYIRVGHRYPHTQIQNDIIRLRRELSELSKMFSWDYKEQKDGE